MKKRQRRLTGVDEIVLLLYSTGLTTGEISAHPIPGPDRERAGTMDDEVQTSIERVRGHLR